MDRWDKEGYRKEDSILGNAAKECRRNKSEKENWAQVVEKEDIGVIERE